MLRKNFFLNESTLEVGKKVYARNRPDMVGVIVDIKTTNKAGPTYGNVPQLPYVITEVRVFYARSKRTSKWLPVRYAFCDLEEYIKEVIDNYSQAEDSMRRASEAFEGWKKNNGDVA